MRLKYVLLAFLGFIFSAASLSDIFELKYPEHFPKPSYNFNNNPTTEGKINLGKALFYDPILSKDSTISCASCHSPYNSFAHTDHDLSHGINDQIGTRNAPSLINLAWHKSFMWDGAVNHLDMQSLAPISHPKEMDEDIKNVVGKLQAKEIYPPLFAKAYGDTIVAGEKVLKALSQFQLTLISADAKYDRIIKGEEIFSEQEQRGYLIFKQNCNTCHAEPLFSTFGFANNGLPVDTTLNDYGKWMVTKQAKDSLHFKIPTLRNLSYTSPYMHDGRFRKLRQVIDHYQNGIEINETNSPEILKIKELTSNDKTDLIAFLLTLNDKNFVFDKKNKYPKDLLHPQD